MKPQPVLLPCPFCGGEPALSSKNETYGHGHFGVEIFVWCGYCTASARRYDANELGRDEATAKAVAAWNNRG